METAHRDNRNLAILCVLAGIGCASTQDAVVKSMSGGYSAYEIILFRCLGSYPILAAMHFLGPRPPKIRWTFTLARQLAVRSVILCFGYYMFVMAIASIAIADAVAIYFTMPFFVAGLAGPLLGERVRVHRWLAIAAAFVGVLIMVRPGAGVLDPASVLALASAAAYAAGQTLGRPLARELPPVVIALGQNTVYLASALLLALVFNSIDFEFSNKSLMFLAKAWVWPAGFDLAVLFATGILAAFGMILFVSAYKSAESTFVAPFEYSAMIWAIIYGLVLFGDFPDSATWTGGAIVVIAGILMILRDRQLDRSLAQTG